MGSPLDENEVAATVWTLHAEDGATRTDLVRALARPEVAEPPFAAGYEAKMWNLAGCAPVDVVGLGVGDPVVGDYFSGIP